VGVGVRAGPHGGTTSDVFTIPGTESQAALDLLDEEMPAINDGSATVVFHTRDGKVTDSANATAISDSLTALGKIDDVSSTPVDPLTEDLLKDDISSNEQTVYTSVSFDVATTDVPEDVLEQMEEATRPAVEAGMEVAFGGAVVDFRNQPTSWLSDHADDIGLLAALIILLVSLRSGTAALMPIATALFALAVSTSATGLLEAEFTIGSVGPVLGSMLGLGVGIDYSLFIVNRYRQNLQDGDDVPTAVGGAVGTAGSAVLFAAITVILAMVALGAMGIPYVRTLGLVAALYVAITVVAALTLLPAFLGLLGTKVLGRHHGERPLKAPTTSKRWGELVTTHPWRFGLAALVLLVLLVIPVRSLVLGLPDDSSAPDGSTQRDAYELLTDDFGRGVNGPLLIVGKLESSASSDPQTELAGVVAFIEAIEKTGGVASVLPGSNPPDYSIVLVEVTPTTGPNSEQTAELVKRLREDVVPDAVQGSGIDPNEVFVGGSTAEDIDLTDRIEDRMALQVAIVLGGSFLLLMMVFRSILVPVKAAILNLLSIGAAMGVLVAVFEWGWVRDTISLQETVVIAAFVPVMMFAILFGLSMDYEVFLMSSVREAYVNGDDPKQAVVTGLTRSARVIVTAATIMICVFSSFVTNPAATVKMLAFGMAVAVLIDAFVVRLVLVPAVLTVLDHRAWWFPHWLDRMLPNLSVDGTPRKPAGPGSGDSGDGAGPSDGGGGGGDGDGGPDPDPDPGSEAERELSGV
jgi:RND superfamily putative drug exporter